MTDVEKKVDTDKEVAAAVVRESAGTTPKNAKPAASAEKTADEINAEQAEAAKAAGKEYQGQQPQDRPTVKDMAVEKAPASGKTEQG